MSAARDLQQQRDQYFDTAMSLATTVSRLDGAAIPESLRFRLDDFQAAKDAYFADDVDDDRPAPSVGGRCALHPDYPADDRFECARCAREREEPSNG